MPNQDDPVLVKMRPQIFGHFDTILRHLRQGHGRRNRGAGAAKRTTGAALIPLNDGEEFFPWPPAGRHRKGRTAGTAVNKEDHRIAAIFTANLDPLIDAADLDVHSLLDAVRRLNCKDGCAELLAMGAISKSR